jgi:hypothetical protein
MKAEDIMMQNQYEMWLRELEDYYSLPMTEDSTNQRLSTGQRVHAKWLDPTDPDMHARWIRGVILSRNDDQTENNAVTYHVKFDDGDDDEELSSDHVLEDSVYQTLLQQKIDQGMNRNVSGIDLIHYASKISSPIKNSMSTFMNDRAAAAALASLNDDDECSYATVESELLCHEMLDPPSPTPTTSEDSNAPEVHYGLFMRIKPSVITPSIEPPRKVVPDDVVVMETMTERPKDEDKGFELTSDANVAMQEDRLERKAVVEEPVSMAPMNDGVDPMSFQLNGASEKQRTESNSLIPKELLAMNGRSKTNHSENEMSKDGQMTTDRLSTNVNGSSVRQLGQMTEDMGPEPKDQLAFDVESYCNIFVFDMFEEACNKSDDEVRNWSLGSQSLSKGTFGRVLIALQLTQMRISKEYISMKERSLGILLSDQEKSQLSYICTEAFSQLVSDIALQLKGEETVPDLTKPKLFEQFKFICMKVTREAMKSAMDT